jgi:YD repeat-containing protein
MAELRADRSSNSSCRTLRPWFVAVDGSNPVSTQCCCDCAWTRILTALQEAGPVALVLPVAIETDAPSILAAGLALGSEWTLHAVVTPDGIDESLRWDGAGQLLEVHALPSSNWRPFDRLAQLHGRAGHAKRIRHQPVNAMAVPLLVDGDFRLRLLNWSTLTRLDQEQGQQWMRRRGLRPVPA